jgi:EmrB/QacA subfamily drug resistance transporter
MTHVPASSGHLSQTLWRSARSRFRSPLQGRGPVVGATAGAAGASTVPPLTPDRLAPGDAPRAPKRPPTSRWVIFGIVSIALFMSSLDSTIVSTGLPTLRHALHAKINWASWTMTGYQLGLVVALPIAGRVSDQLGRKRVFVFAAALFTSASLACGLANNIDLLIGLRVVQAVGGAAFMPSASGMVVEAFGKDRNRALGMFSSIFPMGALVGPIAGGIIITEWSWRGIFLVNVPVGVVFTLLAVRYLPSSRPKGGRADIPGALLLGGTILAAMLAITSIGDRKIGVLSIKFGLPLLLAIVCAVAFLRRMSSTDAPLIPMHLLRGKVFAAMNGINFVWGACAIGFGSLVPLFAEDRYGLSPLASGTLLTARALGEIGLAIVASLLIHRTGFRLPIMVGSGLIAIGLALIGTHPLGFGPYTWLAGAAALTGIGTGISAPASNNASLELSPNDIGAITGLRGACRQGGAIIGVALTTSVVARSTHQAVTLGHSFFVFTILLLLVIPLVLFVPDGVRKRRRVPGADRE